MLEIRRAEDRGRANLGWLNSRHTFSFGDYHDPKFMGYGPLRVINEDRVQPGQGFGTHGHREMEIISYVIDGALEHKDSIGTGSIIRPGDVQRMSAGTGVRHSEFNHSNGDLVHFLQIWILPGQNELPPSYEQRTFTREEKTGRLRLVGSRDGRDGSVTIHQDVDLFATLLTGTQSAVHELRADHKAWVQVARGKLDVNGESLAAGDGMSIEAVGRISFTNAANAEVLLIDMGTA